MRAAREVLGAWFFGDVAYAMLPIITIATIKLAIGSRFDRFLLAPEWSFAAIVFFGLSIRYLLEVKSRFEGEQSQRVDAGTQFRILLIIISVLCLALIEVTGQGPSPISQGFLESAQMGLFAGGLFLLLRASMIRSSFVRARWAMPQDMTKLGFMLHVENSVNTAIDSSDYFSFAMGKALQLDLQADNEFVNSVSWQDTNYSRIREKIARLKRSVEQMEKSFATFSEPPARAPLPYPAISKTPRVSAD